jgi:hypothetical protein
MRKTRVLLFLFVLTGTLMFAQSETKTATLVGNDALLQQISSLKDNAGKVNAAYDHLRASGAGSRSTYAIAVAELNDACNAYIAELSKQRAAQPYNTAFHDAASREIAAVKKIQTDYCPTGK